MSNESRKRTKEWLGKTPSIVLGHDVLRAESASVSGLATTSVLLGEKVKEFTSHKAGVVDGFVVDVYPALTSGQIDVAMSVGGVVKASGALSLTEASRNREWFWTANNNNEVVLSSGDAIQMQYAIPVELSFLGRQGYFIQARTLITYTE